jgi:uncharacterized protein (DUF2141 family)
MSTRPGLAASAAIRLAAGLSYDGGAAGRIDTKFTQDENGDNRIDHGHGSLTTEPGGPVEDAQVYGRLPGPEKAQLYEGRDLDVTTDLRAVSSGHLGQKDMAQAFSRYRAGKPLGRLRA